MKKQVKPSKNLNPYILVILSFVVVILIGSILLYLPFSAASDSDVTWTNWGDFNYYLDCFFTAVSATCVTGLNPFSSGLVGTFNFVGQLIVLLMIQIGGLGFITILTFLLTLFKSKLQFKNRYMLAQAVNSSSLADVIKFVRKVIIISFIFELVGFAMGLPVFLHIYEDQPFIGIWNSVFMSVSAFNNAGFDILGGSSLMDPKIAALLTTPGSEWMYYYLLSYLMLLIFFGGISFMVILDFVGHIGKRKTEYHTFTKIVLATTFTLLILGYLLLMLTDGISGTLNPFDALFQSVTLRTAGFSNVDQAKLSIPGKAICCLWMFIGGSPLSTAGGIKTTTAFVIFLAMYCHLRGKQVVAFKRSYSSNMILKAMTLMLLGIFATIIAMIFITLIEKDNPLASMDNVFFEVFSAFGTVGLSANLTTTLHGGSKIILCTLMFLGRLGPITFFQVFQNNMLKQDNLHFKYIEEDILVG